MNGFSQQNIVGKEAEWDVACIFLGSHWAVRWDSSSSLHKYDIFVQSPEGGRVELVEVKNEEEQKDTGNICVELFQGSIKHPSGIAISESTVYVHYFGDVSVAYRTQQMRMWIKTHPELPNKIFGDNQNGCVLIERSRIAGEWWCEECRTTQLPASSLFND